MTIKLPKSGAVLDKELLITDFCDGRQWSRNLGWVETFHPCRFCLRNRHNEEPPTVLPECRRAQYGPCIKEYEELWVERFRGTQSRIENFGDMDPDPLAFARVKEGARWSHGVK